jgi:Flp pilus assembly secretin CpaC
MILAMNQYRCHYANRSSSGRYAAWAGRFAGVAFAAMLLAAPALPQSVAAPSTPARTAPARSLTAPAPAAAPAPPPVADPGRARKAFDTGRRAEQSGDWTAEFAAYTEAATYDSSNPEYRVLREHARFQVVQSLAQKAERQAVAGNLPAAREMLSEALSIDPSFEVARERLAELSPNPAENGSEKSPRFAGLPRLILNPGTHNFEYRGTTRGAYEEIGKQFGVKMIFDGDLVDRSIHFQVPDVDFETAILVLSLQTKTFTRVVDTHTMFVTQDTAQKEKDYAPEVEKQILLSASVTTDEMNEAVRMVREMTGITRTQLNTATRTLTVRSTEQNVALAQTLLDQIEQPRGELMLDIEILELDRTGTTQLGITPPTASTVTALTLPEIRQLQSAQNNGTLVQTLQSIFGGSAVSSATGSALPALLAFGGGKTIFLATMPSVNANFGTALSTVRSAQRILLRAQDGKPATFFVGDRFPIDLGLLSSDLSSASTALAATLGSALAGGLALPRTDYDVGKSPSSVAIADFNKDGHPDLVVANQADGTLSILMGNGDGTFTVPTSACAAIPQPFPACIQLPGVVSGTTTTAASPSAVVTGDFNDDGNMDIAVTDAANDQVLVLLGNGDGTFLAPVAYPTGSNPVAMIAQDFDGDGQPDLAIVDQGNGSAAGAVSVLLGNKVNGIQNGVMGTKVDYPVGVSPSAIASATFITSGFTSLAVTNAADNTVSILLGHGLAATADGTFVPNTPPTFATGAGPAGVATADFNGDNNQDLAVTNKTDGTVSILLGNGGVNGNVTFTSALNSPFAAGSGPTAMIAENFTGTNTDLAIADETGNNADVLIGNGDGTFNTPISLPTGNAPISLASADLNGDSTLDLVTANNQSATVTVTLNTLATSGASAAAQQTAYPSAEYEDLGVKVKATPRLHPNDEVTLQLQFDIKNLSGSSINGIPILSNRNIEQTIRLREDETSILSGLIQTNEIRSSSGLPWVSTEPGIGLLTGEDTSNIQQTELIILVTPRAMRQPPHEVPAVYAGRGEPSTPPAGPAPGPPEVPPAGVVGPPNQNPQQPGGRGIFIPGQQPGQAPGTQPAPQDQQQPIQQQPIQQQPNPQDRPQAPPQQQ